MISLRKAKARGRTYIDWLDSYHSFSFGEYYDPQHQNFGKLVVLNDDTIAPGKGFGFHPHEDMEIVTLMLSGSLRHEDSEKNKEVIREGQVQRMSAGTGVLHSEVNASSEVPAKLLQIWVLPNKKRVHPEYESAEFSFEKNHVVKIVSGKEGNGLVRMHQDAEFLVGDFNAGKEYALHVRENRGVYVFVIEGALEVNGFVLLSRDALASDESVLVRVTEDAKFLVIDVPL